MALPFDIVWEARTTGSDASGGGVNVATQAGTNLAATSATTASPVVTSATYNFVAGDVGSCVLVKSGTNWTPGFYPIASVSGGAATLGAAVGAVVLYGGATNQNAAAGCATVASPTAGTWLLDHSQRDTARATGTNLTVDATTATDVAPDGYTPSVADIGNVVQITTTGTGAAFTVGFYQVVSIQSGKWRLDRSPAATSSAGATWAMGGALATPGKLATAMAVVNRAFLQAGTYTTSAVITFPGSGSPSLLTTVLGYYQVRGDIRPGVNAANRPQILGTTLAQTVLRTTTNGARFENLIIGPSGVATIGTGISVSDATIVSNCKISAFSTAGISHTGYGATLFCEVSGGTGGTAILVGGNHCVSGCWVHDCSGANGINGGNYTAIVGNLVTNCAGATADGITASGAETHALSNTVYHCGRHGITIGAGYANLVRNNLLSSNGGYGASCGGLTSRWNLDGNAYHANTSGTSTGINDLTNANAVAPYLYTDAILTADPFVAKASDDYRLNTTTGGGSACRGHGVPASWPGNALTTSAVDMGAVQSAAAASGGILTLFGCPFIKGT